MQGLFAAPVPRSHEMFSGEVQFYQCPRWMHDIQERRVHKWTPLNLVRDESSRLERKLSAVTNGEEENHV
jgi:hypothetical protein